jgi:hypothetical protein
MKRKFAMSALLFCISILVQQISAQVSIRNYDTTFRAYPQRDKPHWGWTPVVNFKLNGPVAESAIATVEYSLPDGKPWFSMDCELQSKENKVVKTEDCGQNKNETKTTFLTGSFGYKIKLTDEVEGTNQVLQTGKIKIGKFLYNPANQPEFNKQFYYYLDNDWRLPIGFVFAQTDYSGEYQELIVSMWFKGKEAENADYAGFLFFNGKKIETYTASTDYVSERAVETNPFEYHRRAIKISVNLSCEYPDVHQHKGPKLKDNPGEYELKVTHKGKLVRSVKFTIGKDGFPVDNGIAKNSNLGNNMIIVPVSVLGTLDGTWNKTAWQTEAFWGNTLKGFTAVP